MIFNTNIVGMEIASEDTRAEPELRDLKNADAKNYQCDRPNGHNPPRRPCQSERGRGHHPYILSLLLTTRASA